MCTLYVTLGFTQRYNTYSSMYNYSTTYCNVAADSVEMVMGIAKEDTVWGTVTWVDREDRIQYSTTEYQDEAEYQCPTGNVSGFAAETDGYVWLGGTEWTASAVDPGVDQYTRYSCG